MMSDEEQVTVTLPRSEWEALLTLEDPAKEGYAGEGLALFNAFQAIRQAIPGAQGRA